MIVYRARITSGTRVETINVEREKYSQILELVEALYDWAGVDAVELELVKDEDV